MKCQVAKDWLTEDTKSCSYSIDYTWNIVRFPTLERKHGVQWSTKVLGGCFLNW